MKSLKELLAENEQRIPKRVSNEDRLVWLDMSRKGYTKNDGTEVPGNQGTVQFCPIIDKSEKIVKYLYNVLEYSRYNYDEENDRDYQITTRVAEIPDYISPLTDDQKAKITALRSMILTYGEDCEFWEVKNKSYALMFGYILSHINTENEVITDVDSRKLALIIIPSKNFSKAFQSCLVSMDNLAEMGEEMYNELFSRESKRSCYLELEFQKSAGFGYDVKLTQKSFDRFSKSIMTPEEYKNGYIEIPQDKIDQCNYLSPKFLAGTDDNYDFEEDYLDAAISDITEALNGRNTTESAAEELPEVPENPNEVSDNWDEAPAEEVKPKRGRSKKSE